MASEVTSLAAHGDLWRPNEGRLSSLVERCGWTRLFPPLRHAWDTLGPIRPEVAAATGLRPDVRVVCGSHDSNASLIPYLVSRKDPFTVVSTGTWAILMAVGGKGKLDPEADMLANVDVLGRPVPTARLMLGREFAILAGDAPADIAESDVEAIVVANVMAMPAFSDQGGPFAHRKGRIVGRDADGRFRAHGACRSLLRAHDHACAPPARRPGRRDRRRRLQPHPGLCRPGRSLAARSRRCSQRPPPAPPKARRCSRPGANRTNRRSSSRRSRGKSRGSRTIGTGGKTRCVNRPVGDYLALNKRSCCFEKHAPDDVMAGLVQCLLPATHAGADAHCSSAYLASAVFSWMAGSSLAEPGHDDSMRLRCETDRPTDSTMRADYLCR